VTQGVIKRLFNEKEVTSTLVMDALYCGAKLLEQAGRRWLEVGCAGGSWGGGVRKVGGRCFERE